MGLCKLGRTEFWAMVNARIFDIDGEQTSILNATQLPFGTYCYHKLPSSRILPCPSCTQRAHVWSHEQMRFAPRYWAFRTRRQVRLDAITAENVRAPHLD